MKFTAHSFCSKGGRAYNEDCVYLSNNAKQLVAVVADGLGGHGGGDVASKQVAEILGSCPRQGVSQELIAKYFETANAAVLEKQTDACKMKSTAAMIVCTEEETAIAHIGDTRCYYFYDEKIYSCTVDHSVSQLAVASGEIAQNQVRFHEDRNKIYRAIGGSDKIKPEIVVYGQGANVGDAFLICSDGFWEYILEDEMEIDLTKSKTPEEWLSYMLTRIGERVNGKNDNLSAVVVFCEEG